MAKKLFFLSIVLILAGVILAQDKEPPASNPMTPKSPSTENPPAPAVPVHRIEGEITAINPATHTLTVKSGETMTEIFWDSETRIGGARDEKQNIDLKVGMLVLVRYVEENGKNHARRIISNSVKERPILFRGVITALDAKAKTMSLVNGQEKLDVVWDDNTKYVKNRQPATVDILALKVKIGVHYTETDGKKLARRIILLEDKSPAPDSK